MSEPTLHGWSAEELGLTELPETKPIEEVFPIRRAPVSTIGKERPGTEIKTRYPDELLNALQEAAAAQGINVHQYIRAAARFATRRKMILHQLESPVKNNIQIKENS